QIQFCRFVPALKGLGVRHLTLVCHPALVPLFGSLAGVDRLIADWGATEYPPHDFWIFLLSLPDRLGTTEETIPVAIPYLRPPADRLSHWRNRLAGLRGLRVGLVWRGDPDHPNDRNRSLPGLTRLAPLWSVPETTFISLQKGRGEQEALPPPPDQPLLHLGGEIRDFADTAAIVAHLDLVITIDSAVAHLAGALGKRCWILLATPKTDWRWQLDRADSPWYPETTRLFRQSRPGDWSEVVSRVAQEMTDDEEDREAGQGTLD
ncbi:MAG: pilus assembly protein PilF, partial [Magnetococcales bacterium]|nr:pilus assembly protein PilF [Magnetococcales bacterium]